jgi:hypothetical protein
MNALDFIFGETNTKNLHKSLIELGYVKLDELERIKNIADTNTFKALLRLLVVLSDRQGRDEKRLEDAYAKYPMDLLQIINTLSKEGKK